jgi:AraC-like DNA-binding protein
LKATKTPEIEIRFCNLVPVGPGSAWGPRVIPEYELIYILSGNFTYTETNKETVTIRADQCLLIPPDTEHIFRESEYKEGMISCIHLVPPGDLAVPELETNCRRQPAISVLFRQIAAEFESSRPLREELLRSLGRTIWLSLLNSSGGDAGQISSRANGMLEYLEEHLYEGAGRVELAKQFHLTPEHVNAIFRQELNTTPTNYVNRQRVYRAYRLLAEQGYSVKEAAEAVGFCDAFYFSKLFKRIIGIPPVRISS